MFYDKTFVKQGVGISVKHAVKETATLINSYMLIPILIGIKLPFRNLKIQL